MCSPIILPPENSDYITYIENNYIVMNDKAKNNFSTVRIIPTVKNPVISDEFYDILASSKTESYIIIPWFYKKTWNTIKFIVLFIVY